MIATLIENRARATDIPKGSASTYYFLAAAASVANKNSKLISESFTSQIAMSLLPAQKVPAE